MGVPHSSLPGPLLFLIHRDLPPSVSSESKPVFVAGDTSVIVYDPEKKHFWNYINDVVGSFNKLFEAYKLT
jgi:hypothetical protein